MTLEITRPSKKKPTFKEIPVGCYFVDNNDYFLYKKISECGFLCITSRSKDYCNINVYNNPEEHFGMVPLNIVTIDNINIQVSIVE